LSIFRICLVPVFVILYFTDERDVKVYALIVFAVAGLSDFLDGFIARKFQAQSSLGKLLDPLGDKLMTFAVLICITITRPILLWALLIFFIKEILMGIGGLIIHRKARIELPPSNYLGKASNIVFFFVCAALMLFSGLTDQVAMILISIAIGLTLVALVNYLFSYIKIMKTIPDSEKS